MDGSSRFRLLVFYGGEEANTPRAELLTWLRSGEFAVDARTVAEATPNSKDSVNERVDAAIRWADGAIALITPDKRSSYGSGNVIDEIGRWTGGKSRSSLLVVRQKGVEPITNRLGEIYVGYEARIKEAFEGIRKFLNQPWPCEVPASGRASTQASQLPKASEPLPTPPKVLDPRSSSKKRAPGVKTKASEEDDYTWKKQTIEFFFNRMCDAFPGTRGLHVVADPAEAVERLKVLFRDPVCEEHVQPIWGLRDLGAMPMN